MGSPGHEAGDAPGQPRKVSRRKHKQPKGPGEQREGERSHAKQGGRPAPGTQLVVRFVMALGVGLGGGLGGGLSIALTPEQSTGLGMPLCKPEFGLRVMIAAQKLPA
jgi:hypothetical protein